MTDQDDDMGDAITFLSADHEDVRRLFAEYDELVADDADAEDRVALATEICDLLTAHATAEEEVFYPAVRAALEDGDLIDEAEAEHAGARTLIERIRAMEPSEDGYDAAVRVLSEAVEHHVQEEEGELFPRVRDSELDLAALGEQLAARRDEVLSTLGAEGAA